jgi:hypothetical protein
MIVGNLFGYVWLQYAVIWRAVVNTVMNVEIP